MGAPVISRSSFTCLASIFSLTVVISLKCFPASAGTRERVLGYGFRIKLYADNVIGIRKAWPTIEAATLNLLRAWSRATMH
jgi:hypothetical protein